MSNLGIIFGTIVFSAVVDFLWIGVLMSNFYKQELSSLARVVGNSFTPNIPAAVGVYIALACLILFFVLPATNGTVMQHFAYGALFGFLAYCFYDLTNFSILNGWSIKLVIVDILWGTVLCGMATVVAGALTKYFS